LTADQVLGTKILVKIPGNGFRVDSASTICK